MVGTNSAAHSLCLSLWHAPSLVLHAFIKVQEKSEGISHLRGIELVNQSRGETRRGVKFYKDGKTI